MVLVDTSVWVDFMRGKDDRLRTLLSRPGVLCHPMVIGELACGTLPSREFTLRRLSNLQRAELLDNHTLLTFIESKKLYGKGLGFVDMHLLASAQLGHARWLWTKDKRLRNIAEELGIAYRPVSR